jgi:hypothetical protein
MTRETFIDLSKATPFARELQIATGRIIRQARKLKKLSIVEAAKHLKLSPFYLKALEDGLAYQPVCEIAQITEFYGHGISEFHDLGNSLLLERAIRESTGRRRAHLSLPTEPDSKPWNKPPESLQELVMTSRRNRLNLP